MVKKVEKPIHVFIPLQHQSIKFHQYLALSYSQPSTFLLPIRNSTPLALYILHV